MLDGMEQYHIFAVILLLEAQAGGDVVKESEKREHLWSLGEHRRGSRLEQRIAVRMGQKARLDHKSPLPVQHQAGKDTAVRWEAFLQT